MNIAAKTVSISALVMAFSVWGSEANASGSIVCVPGIPDCSWTSIPCADLAPYAPPGWLCRAAISVLPASGKFTIVKGAQGQASISSGDKVVPIQSDGLRRLLLNIKSYGTTKKPTREELDREREALVKSKDNKVSDASIADARKSFGIK